MRFRTILAWITLCFLGCGLLEAQEAGRPAAWDPNRDPAFKKQYIQKELALDFERVDPRRGISGSVRNEGKMTLTQVRVLLSFRDKQSASTGEYEFSALPWSGPVAPGEAAERPLGPGGSRNFLVYPSSVPAGWSDHWTATVSSIRFKPEETAS